MSGYSEKNYFEDLVRLFNQQNDIRESVKAATERAKESEVEDYKVIKKVAKFFSDNKFEEASAEFAKVKELYDQLAD